MKKYLPIGLDIGTSSIKMAQLRRSHGGLRLAASAKLAIDGDHDEASLVAGIRKLLDKGGFHGRQCISCLRPAEVFIRNIRLPRSSADLVAGNSSLADAVAREAEHKFGFCPASATIRFVHAGEVRRGNVVADELILFAAHRGNVELHLQRLREAGLEAVSLDVQPCALFRVFDLGGNGHCEPNHARIFVDIGTTTKVLISRGHDIVLTKQIEIGGASFDDAIAKELGITVAEASRLRQQGFDKPPEWDPPASQTPTRGLRGKDPEGENAPMTPGHPWAANAEQLDESGARHLQQVVMRAILPMLESLANEISLCLRYYSVTFRGETPDKITFVGGEACNGVMVQLLGKRLDMNIAVPERYDGISVTEQAEAETSDAAMAHWHLAIGLSLKAPFLPPILQFRTIRRLAITGEPGA